MSNENTLLPLVEKLMDKQKGQIQKMQAENLIEQNSLKDDIKGEISKVSEEVKSLVKNQEELETKLVKNDLQSGTRIGDRILNGLKSKEYKEKVINNIGQKGAINFGFNTKLEKNQIVIHDPTSFVAGSAPVVLPFREMGVDKAPVRPLLVSDLIMWGSTTSNMVDWIERTDKTNGAGMRAENATMVQGDLEYTEVSTKVKIASEFMKVTNESLKDVDFLASEINSELLSDLRILVDTQLLSGDGTGNNLKGLLEYASAFDAGNFALAIVTPNNADVLRVAINQIVLAGASKWMPNYILMNPDDVAVLDVTKIADGRYIEIPYYDPTGPSVIRVPIIQNTGITAGDYLVGDFTKGKGFLRDDLTIRIFDQNEDDPIFNRSTVTANIRLAFRVKNQDAGAFVTGTFSTDITALTKA